MIALIHVNEWLSIDSLKRGVIKLQIDYKDVFTKQRDNLSHMECDNNTNNSLQHLEMHI